MKKIIIARCGNGYNGCDAEDVFIYDAAAVFLRLMM